MAQETNEVFAAGKFYLCVVEFTTDLTIRALDHQEPQGTVPALSTVQAK